MGGGLESEASFHHAGQVGGLVHSAEGVVGRAVECRELIVNFAVGGNGAAAFCLHGSPFLLRVRKILMRAGEYGGGIGFVGLRVEVIAESGECGIEERDSLSGRTPQSSA